MDKITLSPVGSLQDTTTAATTINQNFTTVQEAFDNTLSRDGTTPNTMGSNLDMNNYQVLNLPAPATVNSPARLVDVVSNPTITVPPTGTSGATVPLLNGNNTWSGTNAFGAVTGTSLTVSGATTLTGPVTFGSTLTFPGSITNSQLATMAANTIKGNNTGSSATPTDLTAAQVSAMILPTLSVPSLSGNNTWTGSQYFYTGSPWADVKAWGAVGNGTTDDTTAIQNAINYMNSTFGGGVVYLPPGTYRTATGIVLKGAVRLVGSGRTATTISAFNDNVTTAAVYYGSSCTTGCCVEDMTVLGYYNSNIALITGYAIQVASGIRATMKDVVAWYGLAGLYTLGIDGQYSDCWFNGCQDSVVSNGASYFTRCDFDGNGSFSSYRYGFYQGTSPSGLLENSFSQCDFSGNFTNSIYITGTANKTICKFTDGVFSSACSITTAQWTGFHNCELLNITLNGSTGGSVSVVGCFAATPITLTGNYSKAGNVNIS